MEEDDSRKKNRYLNYQLCVPKRARFVNTIFWAERKIHGGR